MSSALWSCSLTPSGIDPLVRKEKRLGTVARKEESG